MKRLACIVLLIGMAYTASAQCCPNDSAKREMGIGLNLTTSLYYFLNRGIAFEPEFRYTIVPGLFDIIAAPGYSSMQAQHVFINWDYKMKGLYFKTGLLFKNTLGIRYTFVSFHEYGDFVMDGDVFDDHKQYVSDYTHAHCFELFSSSHRFFKIWKDVYLEFSGSAGFCFYARNDEIPPYCIPSAGPATYTNNPGNGTIFFGMDIYPVWIKKLKD